MYLLRILYAFLVADSMVGSMFGFERWICHPYIWAHRGRYRNLRVNGRQFEQCINNRVRQFLVEIGVFLKKMVEKLYFEICEICENL